MGDPDPVVAFLAVDGRADRLAAEHVDDGRGHCCTCPAGPQKGHVLWPCNLARLAAAAREFDRWAAGGVEPLTDPHGACAGRSAGLARTARLRQ